jgi:prevent-host-death family protein
MSYINVLEAKTKLSQLLVAAEQGEDVVIARNNVPVARLVPIARKPQPGAWRTMPGWADYTFDPEVLRPLETDEELAAEGWPV